MGWVWEEEKSKMKPCVCKDRSPWYGMIVYSDDDNAFYQICPNCEGKKKIKEKEKEMSEKERPTHEEKVRALKESIIIWEKRVKNLDEPMPCPCCSLDDDYGGGCKHCLIGEKYSGCHETPYYKFKKCRTKENAQGMVIFLKNLLIEILEKGKPRDYCKECVHWVDEKCDFDGECEHRPKDCPPKKEEWVDVNQELYAELNTIGIDGKCYPQIFHDNEEVAFLSCDGWQLAYGSDENYKLEQDERGNFHIFKRV